MHVKTRIDEVGHSPKNHQQSQIILDEQRTIVQSLVSLDGLARANVGIQVERSKKQANSLARLAEIGSVAFDVFRFAREKKEKKTRVSKSHLRRVRLRET
jgi:hypothetical protein